MFNNKHKTVDDIDYLVNSFPKSLTTNVLWIENVSLKTLLSQKYLAASTISVLVTGYLAFHISSLLLYLKELDVQKMFYIFNVLVYKCPGWLDIL